jgi:hypothetical protein
VTHHKVVMPSGGTRTMKVMPFTGSPVYETFIISTNGFSTFRFSIPICLLSDRIVSRRKDFQ